MLNYEKPVKSNKNGEVVDARGKTLCPSMIWRGEKSHIDHQLKIAEICAKALDEYEEEEVPAYDMGKDYPWPMNGRIALLSDGVVEGAPVVIPIDPQGEEVSLNGNGHKKKGNPWGRKGKPK